MNSDCIERKEHRLPCLKVETARSTSARLVNEMSSQDSIVEEKTPYFRHSRNQSNSMEPHHLGLDLSSLCRKILREQNELKVKINYQAKLIKQICKRKPQFRRSIEENLSNNENMQSSFIQRFSPISVKADKRFKFPRDVFTRKAKTRQS